MRTSVSSGRVNIRAAALAAAIGLGLVPAEASAQGYFQQLFGIGNPASAPRPSYRLGAPPAREPREHAEPAASRAAPDHDAGARKYRTMCVRLCDGYYFPVSNATTHQTFQRDVRACESSCGAEARLFYLPAGEGEVDGMTDLTGLAYSSLPNAFKYRKSLVSGCACKPMPWSDAARARHREFAFAAARARGETEPASRGLSDEERPSARSYELPPPISGPGVVVISAAGVVTTIDEPSPAGGSNDDGDVPPAADAAGPSGASTLRARGDAAAGLKPVGRAKITIINASLPTPSRKPSRQKIKPTPGYFGVGIFAAEPRRIVYPGMRVRTQ